MFASVTLEAVTPETLCLFTKAWAQFKQKENIMFVAHSGAKYM